MLLHQVLVCDVDGLIEGTGFRRTCDRLRPHIRRSVACKSKANKYAQLHRSFQRFHFFVFEEEQSTHRGRCCFGVRRKGTCTREEQLHEDFGRYACDHVSLAKKILASQHQYVYLHVWISWIVLQSTSRRSLRRFSLTRST